VALQLPSRSFHASDGRCFCREFGPANRTALLHSTRCVGVASRLGQLRFALGECCLGTSPGATESTALGLRTGLGYVDPL